MRHQVSIITPFHHTSSPQTRTPPLILLRKGLLYPYSNPFQHSLCRRSPKPSPCAWFWVFGPKPPSPRSRLRTRRPRPPQPRVTHHTTTFHHPPSPFDIARPEPSHSGLVSAFRPSTVSPRSRLRTRSPRPPPDYSSRGRGRGSRSRGLHGPCFHDYLFFCNIYTNIIIYFKYFNAKKPRVRKVPRVSLDTA